MRHEARLLLAVYRRLLRLYPTRFRAAFGDEMQATFVARLADRPRDRAGITARELLALLVSAAREHLRERQLRPQPADGAMTTFRERIPLAPYRVSVTVILGMAAAYLLLVVAPFFLLGIHLQPAEMAAGGAFDPKGFAFFQSPVGQWARLAGIIAAVFSTSFSIAFGLLPVYVLVRFGPRLLPTQRRLAGIAIVVAAAMLTGVYSPYGLVILRWYMD